MVANGHSVAYVSQALGFSADIPLEKENRKARQSCIRRRIFFAVGGESAVERAVTATGSRAGHFKKSFSHFQRSDLRLRYEFIFTVSKAFSSATLCEILSVSRTAYSCYQRGGSYQVTAVKQEQIGAVERVFW